MISGVCTHTGAHEDDTCGACERSKRSGVNIVQEDTVPGIFIVWRLVL